MIQFAQPWALLALLSIPAVLVLHALRPRRRRVTLSTTSVWREALQERQRGLGLQRLFKDLSLLLLLLFALVVSLSLGDPRWTTDTTEGSDVVVLLDTSASMQTRSDGPTSRSRFASAKQQAADIIAALPTDRRLLLMTSGRTPRLRSGFENDRDYLRRQLDALEPTDEVGRPRAALELALSLLRNRERGRIYFLTDGAFDEDVDFRTTQIEYRLVGQPARNVAITRFDVRAEIGSEDRYEVLLAVRNYTDERVVVPATVTLRGSITLQQNIELAPGEKKTVVMPVQGAVTGPAQVNIGFDDDLPTDNRAFAVVAADERLHVLLYSEGNYFLESVLRAMANVTVTRRDEFQPDEHRQESRGHDLVVFDRITPPRLEPGRYLLIDAVAPGMPFRSQGSVSRLSVVGRGDSALVKRLALSDLQIDEAQRIVLDSQTPGLQRLFWSADTTLALTLLQGDTRLVFIGFDLHDSNFPLQTAFPLFLHDTLAWLRPRETRDATTQSPAGEPRRITLPSDQLDLVVRTPSGEGLIFAVDRGEVLFEATSQAGIYRYERALAQRHFAVNLTDEQESDIRPRASLPATPPAASNSVVSQTAIVLWPYLMIAAVLLLLLEWGVWCWRPRGA